MAKPKKPLKQAQKSNSQRIVETLLIFAPAPIRQIASSPLGSRILLTVGAGLLATGAMSVHWENGIPQLTFHKDKIGDATQQVKDELNKQGIQWTTNSQGVVFSGDGQQVPVPIQSLPGFQASYQNEQPYFPPTQGFQLGNLHLSNTTPLKTTRPQDMLLKATRQQICHRVTVKFCLQGTAMDKRKGNLCHLDIFVSDYQRSAAWA
jgi:hypothetical protein